MLSLIKSLLNLVTPLFDLVKSYSIGEKPESNESVSSMDRIIASCFWDKTARVVEKLLLLPRAHVHVTPTQEFVDAIPSADVLPRTPVLAGFCVLVLQILAWC